LNLCTIVAVSGKSTLTRSRKKLLTTNKLDILIRKLITKVFHRHHYVTRTELQYQCHQQKCLSLFNLCNPFQNSNRAPIYPSNLMSFFSHTTLNRKLHNVHTYTGCKFWQEMREKISSGKCSTSLIIYFTFLKKTKNYVNEYINFCTLLLEPTPGNTPLGNIIRTLYIQVDFLKQEVSFLAQNDNMLYNLIN
jgi:hypothetical protein